MQMPLLHSPALTTPLHGVSSATSAHHQRFTPRTTYDLSDFPAGGTQQLFVALGRLTFMIFMILQSDSAAGPWSDQSMTLDRWPSLKWGALKARWQQNGHCCYLWPY